MPPSMRRLGLMAAAALLLLTAACRGDDTAATSATLGVPATPQPQAAAPAAQPAATTTAQAQQPAAAQNDPVVAADCLRGVKSYRYNGKASLRGGSGGGLAGDVTFDGAYIAPDRSQFRISFGSQAVETIGIGQDTWTKFGSAPWVKAPAGSQTGTAFAPDVFCESNLRDLAKAGVRPTRDKVGATDALRYEFDKKAIGRLSGAFGANQADVSELPDNTRLTLWVTEKERWPLRVTLSGDQRTGNEPFSINLEFNVTDLNQGSVRIDPPA
ncbi:MAG: hypothetical protein U0531_02500 [Dehalococcoidia bacterium]